MGETGQTYKVEIIKENNERIEAVSMSYEARRERAPMFIMGGPVPTPSRRMTLRGTVTVKMRDGVGIKAWEPFDIRIIQENRPGVALVIKGAVRTGDEYMVDKNANMMFSFTGPNGLHEEEKGMEEMSKKELAKKLLVKEY